jgi:hypothetical protein
MYSDTLLATIRANHHPRVNSTEAGGNQVNAHKIGEQESQEDPYA